MRRLNTVSFCPAFHRSFTAHHRSPSSAHVVLITGLRSHDLSVFALSATGELCAVDACRVLSLPDRPGHDHSAGMAKTPHCEQVMKRHYYRTFSLPSDLASISSLTTPVCNRSPDTTIYQKKSLIKVYCSNVLRRRWSFCVTTRTRSCPTSATLGCPMPTRCWRLPSRSAPRATPTGCSCLASYMGWDGEPTCTLFISCSLA